MFISSIKKPVTDAFPSGELQSCNSSYSDIFLGVVASENSSSPFSFSLIFLGLYLALVPFAGLGRPKPIRTFGLPQTVLKSPVSLSPNV